MKDLYFSGVFIFDSVITNAQAQSINWQIFLRGSIVEQMYSPGLYNEGVSGPDMNDSLSCQKSAAGHAVESIYKSTNTSTQLFPP
jgi:hypothetical protein